MLFKSCLGRAFVMIATCLFGLSMLNSKTLDSFRCLEQFYFTSICFKLGLSLSDDIISINEALSSYKIIRRDCSRSGSFSNFVNHVIYYAALQTKHSLSLLWIALCWSTIFIISVKEKNCESHMQLVARLQVATSERIEIDKETIAGQSAEP